MDLVEHWKRQIDIACLSGFASLSAIEGVLVDQIENEEFEPPIDEASRQALASELIAFARKAWERASALEATWTARTPLDRIDDALADLDGEGLSFRKIVGCTQQGDLFGAGWWSDENDPFQRDDATFELWLDVALAHGALVAKGHIPWSSGLRRDQFEPVAVETIRVLGHHGLEASFSEKEHAVLLEPIPFQKRRASTPPGVANPAPPRPASRACDVCGGKGWIQLDPTSFPELCVCKGGKSVPQR